MSLEMGELPGPSTPVEMSADVAELAAALAAAQGEFTAVGKSHSADMRTHAYRYADLADVWQMARPVLARHGLSVVQLPAPAAPQEVALRTMLLHKSGQWLAGVGTMPCDTSKPQSVGSAITYLRRYQLGSVLGIVTDDDDDAQSAGHAEPRHQHQPQQQARQAGGRPPHQQGRPRQHDGPPRSGRALFAWIKDQEAEGAQGLLKWANDYGNRREFGKRMVDWSDADAVEAYEALQRQLEGAAAPAGREPGSDDGDDYQF
jgi:hypothetical protein